MKIFSNIKWAIIVGSFCLWVLSVEHIARESEKEIIAAIDTFSVSSESGLIKPSLIEYKRSFLSSSFSMGLSSDHPSIDNTLGNIIVVGKVQHGPLMLVDKHLALKTAHIDFSLHGSQGQEIKKRPFSAQISVDYDLMRRLNLKLDALNLDISGIALATKESSMKYVFHPDDTFLGELELRIPELTLSDRENQAQIIDGRVLLSLSTAENETDSLRFLAKEASLNIFDVISENNVTLAAEVAFTDTDVVSIQTDMVVKDNVESSTKIKVDHLNLDSFKDTFLGFLNYRNLSDQIDWTLEDFAYSPDGQDRLYELLGRLDENSNEISNILAQQLLTPHKSRIQITQTGNTNFSADLGFLGVSNIDRQSPWYNSLAGTIQSNETLPEQSWFSQLKDYTIMTVSDITESDALVQSP